VAKYDSDHSLPTSAEVKNVWSYIFTCSCAFMAWYSVTHRINLHDVVLSYHKGNFTLLSSQTKEF
jgi:hypothetical protein